MKTLREVIGEAQAQKVAIGHFNISNTEGLWGVFRAAQALNVPVIIGVSEGERDFIGVKQVKALVDTLKQEFNYPVFLNADHTYTFERVQEVVDAGYDAVTIDGSKMSFEENVAFTKKCVEYAKSKNPNMIVEGELGYIGTSSKLLDEIPEDVVTSGEGLTTPEQAQEFVEKTGVDLLAPAVGNVHGMLKATHDPRLDIDRVSKIYQSTNVPLVLHGGSGTVNEDFTNAIKAGVAIVHINTEVRVAYRDALRLSLQEFPDEVAPYKILKPAVQAIEKVTSERLKLFNQ
ncbi:MAG: class II fructose-bisphosphate aldolase [Candidatus Vogelbacteria bacterium]|nr:class II fructose-bisphosphate aldolase [Candidatus Vogelbacteria bacterium]